MLVTSIFFLWFAWDAIICENAFELLASGVLGLAVCARIIYFVVRRVVSLLICAASLVRCLVVTCMSAQDIFQHLHMLLCPWLGLAPYTA